MARAQVNIPVAAGVTIHENVARIVRVKSAWSDDWKVVDYLYPVSAQASVGPSVSRAVFRFDYGSIKREDVNSYADVQPVDLRNQFIQIVIVNDHTESVLWTGIVADQVFACEGSRNDPDAEGEEKALSGTQLITAYGLEHLLDQATIRGGWAYNADLAAVVGIEHQPMFNERRRYGFGLSGNRSTTAPALGIHTFSDDGAVWTNGDILDYVLHYHRDGWGEAADDLEFTVAGQPELLDNVKTWHRLEGLTVLQAVNHLIDRRRGIGWCIRCEGNRDNDGNLLASAGPVVLHIFSIFGEDVDAAGTAIAGNRQQIRLVLTPREVERALVKHTTSAQYDRIIVLGARVKSCFTVSFADSTLEKGWTTSEESDYRTALGSDEKLNDAYRKEDHLKRVYQCFRIPRSFDWYTGNGLGTGGTWSASPVINPDGTIDNSTVADYYNVNRPLLRGLPLMTTPGASDTEPEALKPIILVKNPDDSFHYQVEALDAIQVSPCRVRMIDGEMAFSVSPAIGHVLGLNHFNPSTDGATNIDLEPKIDYETMIATVFAETDERLKVIETVPNYANLKQPRTLTLHVPDAELWYIPYQTVSGVNSGALQYYGSGTTLRDDSDRLRLVAALAMQWYRELRTAVEVKCQYLSNQVKLGTYVASVGDETCEADVGTVVSSIAWDFLSGRTIIRTSYWELDVARLADVPGMSNLRAVGRAIQAMQQDMIELRRHIGNLPVRWPASATAGREQYGKAQQYSGEATNVAWKETATAGIAEVKVKLCDEDGNNVTGSEFSIYCYHSTAADPNIRVDMVIPFHAGEGGRYVTLSDYHDGKIGDVKMWAEHSGGTPQNIPFGWELADGTGYSQIDMQDQSVGGYKSGGTYFSAVGTPANWQIYNTYDANRPFQTIAFIERVY